MRPAQTLLLLLLLAAVANGQSVQYWNPRLQAWVLHEIPSDCGDGSCSQPSTQPQKQIQPQQSQQRPQYKPRLVPVKPIPQAEAQPQPPTPQPEQPDWKAWEKRLDAIEKRTHDQQATATATASTLVTIQQTIADQKPCQCDHAALLARISELEQQLAKAPPPPDYDALAAEIQKRLTHSATITLLDGTTKTQTQPLSTPLEFNQRIRNPLGEP